MEIDLQVYTVSKLVFLLGPSSCITQSAVGANKTLEKGYRIIFCRGEQLIVGKYKFIRTVTELA
jgi:hypothetical protein